jgi:hypothetical protein
MTQDFMRHSKATDMLYRSIGSCSECICSPIHSGIQVITKFLENSGASVSQEPGKVNLWKVMW